ncbi:MAG: hypothetical protein KBF92_00925 [Bacteroidia bacterium]|jgi:hypothetical protein|nr:hypothetical protein [Candidatus Brachybacter algidus]MBK8747315.1 hypothetical protein [Candidatus Brachybacter algidus]MBK9023818.1 hypothetical protein [Candidatus Brachybacter algidus]MBP9922363.1 hypothetical protein [Bacteroidia bacterium]
MQEIKNNVWTLFEVISEFNSKGIEITKIYKINNSLYLANQDNEIYGQYSIGPKYSQESNEISAYSEVILKKWSIYENRTTGRSWLFISKYSSFIDAKEFLIY